MGVHVLVFGYEMTRPATLLFPFAISCSAGLALWPSAGLAQNLGDPVDVALEFQRQENAYFLASRVASFTPATGRGSIQWDRYVRQPGLSFNKVDANLARSQSAEFPGTEYDRDPTLPFAIDFVTPRTIRLRFSTRDVRIDARPDSESIMLAGPVSTDLSSQSIQVGPGGVRVGHDRWDSRRRRDRRVHDRFESRGRGGGDGCRTVTIRERLPGGGVRIVKRRDC